jgi:hypothetical protein
MLCGHTMEDSRRLQVTMRDMQKPELLADLVCRWDG